MGAMQAQDYTMAKWAIGHRMVAATDETVESAINEGHIIRTHLLRPIWHFVSAGDIHWMLELTALRIKASMNSRNRELELSPEVFTKCFDLIGEEMSGGNHLTRQQIAGIVVTANIKTDENRLSHILMEAELEGLICSGRKAGNKLTYGLLSERVPFRINLTRDESLARLAIRYFTSHGPATVKDFALWSGLSAADVRLAMNYVKPDLIFENTAGEQYWFSNISTGHIERVNPVHLLPAFDEFLISYKDRSSSLSLVHNKKAVSDNGIFRPVVVINGQVTGTWKRTNKKDKVIITADFFHPQTTAKMQLVDEAALALGLFLNKNVEIGKNS